MHKDAEEETGIILRNISSMQGFSPDEWALFSETGKHTAVLSDDGNLQNNKSYNPFLSYAIFPRWKIPAAWVKRPAGCRVICVWKRNKDDCLPQPLLI